MDRACNKCGSEEECMKRFDGKARSKESTRKTYRCRWEDNTRMDFKEIG
jgi:hypothetical protein